MGSFSPLHWLVVIGVVVLLFGSGKISGLMGDVAKGIKSFKKTMAEDTDASMEASAEKPVGNLEAPTVASGVSSNATSNVSHS
jgi:sec-independent protein translocase protein TatA